MSSAGSVLCTVWFRAERTAGRKRARQGQSYGAGQRRSPFCRQGAAHFPAGHPNVLHSSGSVDRCVSSPSLGAHFPVSAGCTSLLQVVHVRAGGTGCVIPTFLSKAQFSRSSSGILLFSACRNHFAFFFLLYLPLDFSIYLELSVEQIGR